MTKMPLYGHKGLELLREGILVFRLVRDKLKRGFILSGFCRKRVKAEKERKKEEKGKERKAEGFCSKESVCGSPSISLHFSWS